MRARRIARRRGSNPRRPLRGGGSIAITYPFTLDSLVPNTINQGAANTPVNANGQDFQSGSNIFIDGASQATTFVNATLLTFTFPAALALVPGYKTIVVKRTTFTSNSRLFAVLFPVPTLTSASLAGNVLSVGGTGFFAQGTRAFVDTTLEVPFTYLTATTGTCLIPQSVLDVPGVHTVRIMNDAPGGGVSGFRNFDTKYKNSTLISLSVTQQYRGRPSGTITLTGDPGPDSIFYSVSDVKVDGTSVSFTLIDANHLTFNIPGALLMTAGNHAVTVSNPTTGGGGGTSNALQFLAFSPTLDGLSITEVPQYFDGFDNNGHVDMIDSNFEATFNNVPQPTSLIDSSNFVVHMTSAAIAVPGITTVRLRDTISGATTNSLSITVIAWDPTAIGSALRWWLIASNYVDDGSGRASAWNDASGGARNIAQPTAGMRPLYVASSPALNNQPVLRFDNTRFDGFTSGVTYVVNGAAGIINRDQYNIWVVGNATLAIGNAAMMLEPNNYIAIAQQATSPQSLRTVDDSGGAVSAAAPFTYSGGAAFVYRARKDPQFISARVNRNAEVQTAWSGVTTSFNPAAVQIASRGASSGWKGDLAEIIATNADLNYTYKALIDNMLSSKYGLPFSTPGTAPVIGSVTPNTATRYDPPFDFIVANPGGGYTPKSIVNVRGVPLATTYLSPTQLKARFPNTELWTTGGRAISVADVTGISAPAGITVFDYVPVAGPNLLTCSPSGTVQFNNAINVTFQTLNCSPAAVVYANGVACSTIVDSPTQVRATLPATALYALPGPTITIHDGAAISNPLEFTLTPWSAANFNLLTGLWRSDSLILSGGKCVTWTDISNVGTAAPLTQATTANQGNYNASDPNFNGRPSVDFDGSATAYAVSTVSMLALITNTAWTVTGVYRLDSISTTAAPTQPYNANQLVGATNVFTFGFKNSPPTAYGGTHDGTFRNAQNTGVAIGQTQQFIWSLNAGTLTTSINGIAGTPITGVGTTTAAAQFLGLGRAAGYASPYFDGQVAELAICNGALTAQDVICWNNYCRAVYGTA